MIAAAEIPPGVRERMDEQDRADGAAAATAADAPFAVDLASSPRVIEHVGADAIFAAVGPPDWLCERLFLARASGVACLGGYGFSGKTVMAQSIALSLATGRDVFGVFPCKRARVLHLDYEQGSRLTRERYQRLARAMGVDLADVADRLRLAVYPAVYLDDDDAADVFARTLEGFDLAIVDALRGAAPTLDENDSAVRRVIDLLARISERGGTLPLMLLHSRKPPPASNGNDPPADARFSLRGSSALYDALCELYVLGGAKGEPTRVQHEKEKLYGVPAGDFGLRVEDVEGAHEEGWRVDPRWGLRVVHLDREQLDKQPTRAGGTQAKHAERIVSWLAAHSGAFAGNKGALCEAIGMQREAFFKAFSTIEGSRVRVEAARKSTGARISLIPEVSP